MSVTLSDQDLRGLNAALTALLSPLDHSSSAAWLAESGRQLAVFLGADQALGMTPEPTPGASTMTGMGYDIPHAVAAYREFIHLDSGLHEKRQRLGLEVYHQRHLYDLSSFHRNPVYNEWAAPNRLMDVIGMGFNPVPGQAIACLHFYHDRDYGPEDVEKEAFGPRGLALLRLLLPAWKSGIRLHLTFRACRDSVGQLIDHLEEGVAVYDERGRELHRNSALRRLLESDPEGGWLASVIRVVGAQLSRSRIGQVGPAPDQIARLSRAVSTKTARYAIESGLSGGAALGLPSAVIVVVRRLDPHPLSDAELKSRFRLTDRECETARLLAAGYSNAEVASLLRVTGSTARRHTEAVLRKLGVASRSAVGPALRGRGRETG